MIRLALHTAADVVELYYEGKMRLWERTRHAQRSYRWAMRLGAFLYGRSIMLDIPGDALDEIVQAKMKHNRAWLMELSRMVHEAIESGSYAGLWDRIWARGAEMGLGHAEELMKLFDAFERDSRLHVVQGGAR